MNTIGGCYWYIRLTTRIVDDDIVVDDWLLL